MGHYTYYDRNFFANSGSYPLFGDHYQTLLQCCFEHSAYVSFLQLDRSHPFFGKLEKWKVPNDSIMIDPMLNMRSRCVYAACETLFQEMLRWTTNLFSLYTLLDHEYPEDPVFIRNDGSVFFDSIIHEGECSIYPRMDECINDVLSYGHWLYINDSGYPEAPAKEHQFPFPALKEIQEDQLYKKLLMIRDDPFAYIPALSVDAIYMFVDNYRPPWLKKDCALPTGFSSKPKWYFAFEMYILGECNALTCTNISTAFAEKGMEGTAGFYCYFAFLSQYIGLIKTGDGFA